MGQIINREYTVFPGSNISCGLAWTKTGQRLLYTLKERMSTFQSDESPTAGKYGNTHIPPHRSRTFRMMTVEKQSNIQVLNHFNSSSQI